MIYLFEAYSLVSYCIFVIQRWRTRYNMEIPSCHPTNGHGRIIVTESLARMCYVVLDHSTQGDWLSVFRIFNFDWDTNVHQYSDSSTFWWIHSVPPAVRIPAYLLHRLDRNPKYARRNFQAPAWSSESLVHTPFSKTLFTCTDIHYVTSLHNTELLPNFWSNILSSCVTFSRGVRQKLCEAQVGGGPNAVRIHISIMDGRKSFISSCC
jgi:hypothetical protein